MLEHHRNSPNLLSIDDSLVRSLGSACVTLVIAASARAYRKVSQIALATARAGGQCADR